MRRFFLNPAALTQVLLWIVFQKAHVSSIYESFFYDSSSGLSLLSTTNSSSGMGILDFFRKKSILNRCIHVLYFGLQAI